MPSSNTKEGCLARGQYLQENSGKMNLKLGLQSPSQFQISRQHMILILGLKPYSLSYIVFFLTYMLYITILCSFTVFRYYVLTTILFLLSFLEFFFLYLLIVIIHNNSFAKYCFCPILSHLSLWNSNFMYVKLFFPKNLHFLYCFILFL